MQSSGWSVAIGAPALFTAAGACLLLVLLPAPSATSLSGAASAASIGAKLKRLQGKRKEVGGERKDCEEKMEDTERLSEAPPSSLALL